MVVGIAGLFLIGKVLEREDTIFWVEVWGLTLFGLGWLVAGSYRSDSAASWSILPETPAPPSRFLVGPQGRGSD